MWILWFWRFRQNESSSFVLWYFSKKIIKTDHQLVFIRVYLVIALRLVYANNPSSPGIYVYQDMANVTIDNCTVYGHNQAVRIRTRAAAAITDCVLAHEAGSIGVFSATDCTADITYTDVYGFSTPYRDCSPGTGCISADPLFVDPAAGDFHLAAGSPCIGTASDSDDMGYRPPLAATVSAHAPSRERASSFRPSMRYP